MMPQKPNIKIPPLVEKWMSTGLDRAADGMRYIFGLSEGWQKRRDVLKNNYDLGVLHLSRGNYMDATFRFKLATWIDASYGPAWYNLGRSYLAEGKKSKALMALTRALQLMPNHEETKYMTALVMGRKASAKNLPKRMPPELCREHFESLAENYDYQQIDVYQYEAHLQVESALRPHLEVGRIDHDVLDLGVGTGLCASRLRDVSARIVGVDFSANMLAEAIKLENDSGRRLYDELVKSDVEAYLEGLAESRYDVVIACGLLSYIGQAHSLLQQVARVLKKGGLFAFTVDKCDGVEYHFLPEEGRFGFSEPYLRSLAANLQMGTLKLAEVDAYPGQKVWLCVWRK